MPMDDPAVTVGDVMLRARSSVPAALVPPEEVVRLAAYGRLLPASIVPAFCYEFRLGEDPRVDTSYALFDAARTLAPCERLVADRRSRASPAALASWERLLVVMRAWAAGTGLIGRGVRVLMLELDAMEPADALPLPLFYWHAIKEWSTSAPEHLQLLEEMIGVLAPTPPPLAPAREAFRLAFVEANGVEPTFGYALGRSPQVLRVVMAGLAPQRAVQTVEALGWEGSAPALRQLLDRLAPLSRDLAVSVDVADGRILPRLGVEIFRTGPLLPALDILEGLGLCAPEKVRALRELGEEWQWYAASDGRQLGRRMAHYKLSFIGSSPSDAKAYLRYAYSDGRQP